MNQLRADSHTVRTTSDDNNLLAPQIARCLFLFIPSFILVFCVNMFLEFTFGVESKLIWFEDHEIEDVGIFVQKSKYFNWLRLKYLQLWKINYAYEFRAVLDEFGQTNRVNRELVLRTPAGSLVPPHKLKHIVHQFKGCGCWTLKILFTDLIEPSSALAKVFVFFCVFEFKN